MDDSTPYISIPAADDAQCIRIFDVHAPLKDHDEAIRGELRIVDLKSNPCYSTLSYVWGSSDAEHQFVHWGPHRIPLLPNGYSALKALRKKLGKFTIWVDAICINQSDDEEKQRQIPLMGDIYSKAESGYIWLGAGDPRVQRAMKYLARPPYECFFEAESQVSEKRWPRPTYYTAALVFIWQRFKIKSPRSPTRRHFWTLPFSTTIEDIDVLLQNEWVERVWTYQELLLSRRPVLVYGNDHLDWDTFAISVGSLDYSPSVNTWFNLALARDAIYHPVQKWSSDPVTSPIQQRSRFMEDVQRTARRIEGIGLYSYLVALLLLAYIPIIPLVICGFVAVGMYAGGQASDVGNPFNYRFCWGVVWALVAWLVFWILSHLLLSGCFRLSLRSLCNPSGLDKLKVDSLTSVNIIDAVLKRKSKHVHDKAFSMQSVLKTLSKGQLDCPTPEYKRELGPVFRDFNIQILTAIGHQQLLYIAALAPLPGQPCWMPDWTADIDSTWLSPDIHLNDRETLDYAFQIASKKIELVGDSLQVFAWDIYDPEWSTISFEDCTNTNGEEERAVHLRTIQAALGIFAFLQAAKDDVRTYVDERESLKELQHLLSAVTKQAPSEVKKWLLFLQKHRQTDPEATLRSLRRLPKLFQTHVALCGAFSRDRKQLFYCKQLSDYTRSDKFDKVCSFGVCLDGIDMLNAGIVVIFGLYMPFLVRFGEGTGNRDNTGTGEDQGPVIATLNQNWFPGTGEYQRPVAATLLSPILFAGSLGFEDTKSGRLRFMHWECGGQARKIILKLE